MKHSSSIDDYILGFAPDIQERLTQLRICIQETVPQATETIKYGMPTFVLKGNLVHFAAFKHHIGFYPTPSPIVAFRQELSIYKTSKGAIQFPFDQPIPFELIRRILAFRVKESMQKG